MEWLTRRPLAHRGLHAPAGPAENTLAAFEAAAAAGYAIELDVHLAADGVPVVVHDRDLTRLTGRALRVEQLSATELAGLRVLGTEDGIPSLAAALDVVGDRVPVMVEIKNPARRTGRLETAVRDALRTHPGPVAVASFNPLTVGWFAEHAPAVPRGQVAGTFRHSPVPRWLRPVLRSLVLNRRTRPHYVSYELAALPNRFATAWRARGLALVTWTVRTAEDRARAERLADTYIFEAIRPPVSRVAGDAGATSPAPRAPGSGSR